ncbi:type IV-A pilus assembly ATPase PilB [Oceanospirillum beijerinckii]|uniref:type IV-A pilus assembly ATPase PilB n=1 Tax=Oceanospirillum beijerinckii TaxID=64976 RepID=UPI0004132CAE|nr:type IV-A pilus assembly ATPase PilB [Oceanospirillum beijerinckii]
MNLEGIARRLTQEKVLDTQTALTLQEEASQHRQSFLQYAASRNKVSNNALALAAAREFGMPFIDLTAFDRKHLPRNLVKDSSIRHHMVLPLYLRGNKLFLAIANPTNLAAVDEIQFQTNLNIEAILVAYDQLKVMIDAYLEGDEEALAKLEEDELNSLKTSEEDNNTTLVAESTSNTNDAPIVKFVNKILLDAIKLGSSDIHLEPYERKFRIRYRTDGLLHEALIPPFNLRHRITSRIKVMAHLDISERRIPQDGSIKLKVSKSRTIDFRVNTLPTIWGEKVVLRVLDSSASRINIDELGFIEAQQSHYQKTLLQPQGMILVTGPTGSGKTVTLYTGLNILNTPERNISSAEDPVEINLEGINQVNVNTKVGLDFATALRAFLRQDPDVVMVGEIRDLETAEIAIKAAQTGHLVLSTLHTNSAAETLTRLSNMGIPAYNIATSVNLIIAQRLARKLCPICKVSIEIPIEMLLSEGLSEQEIKQATLFDAVGCEACHQGYKGRVGIYEVMPISTEISRLIINHANSIELAEQARKEGSISLRYSGLIKALNGITSLTEINRVTQD